MHKANSPVGVFGGTFDPIHYGHLRIAEELVEAAGLARLHLIPTGAPPHRDAPAVTAETRLQMVRLAVGEHPLIQVDDREVRRHGQCYTVDTLTELRAEYGAQTPLLLLTGTDAFLGLSSWRRWQLLFELAHVVVARRPGFAQDDWLAHMPDVLRQQFLQRRQDDVAMLRHSPAGGIALLTVTQLEISATALRQMFRSGRSPRYLLPDVVVDFIRARQLYL